MKQRKIDYTIDSHFANDYQSTRKLFDQFVSKLKKIDNRIEIIPMKQYIGIKIGARVVVAILVWQSKLKLHLYRVEPKDLNDPRGTVKYKTNSFEDFNKHISYFDIFNDQDLDYGLKLTTQVIDKFF